VQVSFDRSFTHVGPFATFAFMHIHYSDINSVSFRIIIVLADCEFTTVGPESATTDFYGACMTAWPE
jgi:hypothetical protein